MKSRRITLFALLAAAASLLVGVAMASGAAAEGGPLATLAKFSVKPLATLQPNLFPVNIPDQALHQALHAATGVPDADDIYPADLAQLNGALNLSGKGIADASGLQYCVNITDLNLDNNKLTALPDSFKKLTKLKRITVMRNKLANFPPVLLLLPSLADIRLTGNSLAALPDNIDAITSLKILYVDKNALASLPHSIKNLAKLQILYCNENKLKKLPKEVFQAPALETLVADKNELTEIPSEVKSAPKLMMFSVSYNKLTKLPAGIGNAPALKYFLAGYNALTSVEPSLYGGSIQYLFLNGNRLKSLPDAMSGKSFTNIQFQWNYMDVAPGTKNRAIIDSLDVSDTLHYEYQLSPVSITASSSTQDSVTLQWKPLSDGSVNNTSWKVEKFVVYDATGAQAEKLQTLDETANEYTAAGLAPGKEYNLFVRVYYELNEMGTKSQTSCDTYVKVTTLAAGATQASTEAPATEQATAEATPSAAESTQASAEPSPTPEAMESSVPASAAGSDSGVITAIIAVGGALVAAVVVLIIVLVSRGKPKTIRIRR